MTTPSSGVAAGSLTPDEQAGRVVRREPAAIASALVELGADRTLRRALGARARERATRFTWEESARATLSLYRSLLSEPA